MERRSMSLRIRAAAAGAAALLIMSLGGCEAVFTTSLFSFLQRDPAGLSPEQQVAWAEQALASGEPEAMAEAYELVKDDPANSLLAARLALELSGVPGVLAQLLQDLETVLNFTLASELEAYFDGQVGSVDATYAAAAGAHFEDALAADPGQLSGQDMILGTLCLAFDEADPGGFANPLPSTGAFISSCLAALPAGDPAEEILNQLALMP